MNEPKISINGIIFSKSDIENKYINTDTQELTTDLGITKPTLLKYLRILGIEIKPVGKRKVHIINS
jgi:hypothetical protein